MTAPSFDDIFAAMSAASVGHVTARVALPDNPQLDDVPTRFALGLNVLLDDLSFRMSTMERMADRLRILAEASRDFSAATPDRDRLLDTVARRLATVMKDSLCQFFLLPMTNASWCSRRFMRAGRRRTATRVGPLRGALLLLEDHP